MGGIKEARAGRLSVSPDPEVPIADVYPESHFFYKIYKERRDDDREFGSGP